MRLTAIIIALMKLTGRMPNFSDARATASFTDLARESLRAHQAMMTPRWFKARRGMNCALSRRYMTSRIRQLAHASRSGCYSGFCPSPIVTAVPSNGVGQLTR